MRGLFVPIATLVVTLISGCATNTPAVEKIDSRAGSLINANRITITQSTRPESYSLEIGGAFNVDGPPVVGTIAAILIVGTVARDTSGKVPLLNSALDPSVLRLRERFSEATRESIADLGIDTEILKIPQDVPYEAIPEYSKKNGSSDYLLILDISGGFSASGLTSSYFPLIGATASLRNVRTGEVLYQEQFIYRHWSRLAPTRDKNAKRIKAFSIYDDDSEKFYQLGDITENPESARNEMIKGLKPIVAAITDEIEQSLQGE